MRCTGSWALKMHRRRRPRPRQQVKRGRLVCVDLDHKVFSVQNKWRNAEAPIIANAAPATRRGAQPDEQHIQADLQRNQSRLHARTSPHHPRVIHAYRRLLVQLALAPAVVMQRWLCSLPFLATLLTLAPAARAARSRHGRSTRDALDRPDFADFAPAQLPVAPGYRAPGAARTPHAHMRPPER